MVQTRGDWKMVGREHLRLSSGLVDPKPSRKELAVLKMSVSFEKPQRNPEDQKMGSLTYPS